VKERGVGEEVWLDVSVVLGGPVLVEDVPVDTVCVVLEELLPE
jgi:hypothetical protein